MKAQTLLALALVCLSVAGVGVSLDLAKIKNQIAILETRIQSLEGRK